MQKLYTKPLRPGPEKSEEPDSRAFDTIVQPAIEMAMPASTTQVISHASDESC